MIPFPEYLLWIGATLLAGYVAALSWRLGVARHFPLLTSYLVLSLFAGLARWVTFARCNCQSLDGRLVRRNLEIERAAINVLHL